MSAPRSRASSASSAARSKDRPPHGSISFIRSIATAIRAALDGLLKQRSGRINHDFRLRGADGHYLWFLLEGAARLNAAGEVVRVIGTLADVTEIKTRRGAHPARCDPRQSDRPAQSRIVLRPARSALLAGPAPGGAARRRWRSTSTVSRRSTPRIGMSFGDSALLTVARRARARSQARRHAGADRRRPVRRHRAARGRRVRDRGVRRVAAHAARHPISFGDHEVALTASIGLALFDPQLHAKAPTCSATRRSRSPTPRRPAATAPSSSAAACAPSARDRLSLAKDLRHALDRGEISVLLPADRAARGPHRRRLRGDAALASSASRRARARPISSRSPKSSGALVEIGVFALESHGARTRGLAERARSHAADLRQHQHLVAPDARPRPSRRRQRGAQPPLRRCAAR